MEEVSNDFLNENAPLSPEEMAKRYEAIQKGQVSLDDEPTPAPLALPEVEVTAPRLEDDGSLDDQGNPIEKPEGIIGYTGDIAKGVGVGVVNAGSQILHTAAALGDAILPMEDKDYLKKLADEYASPDLADAQTMPGKLAQTTAQFMTGFLPALKAMRVIGGLNSANKAVTVAKTAAGAGTAGAIADFSAFDPLDERISNWAASFDNPVLNNGITQWLKSDQDDPELLGRVKQSLEGLLVGKMLEPVMHVLGMYKNFKTVVKEERGELPPNLTATADLPGANPGETIKVPVEQLGVEAPRFTLKDPILVPLEGEQRDLLSDALIKGDYDGAGALYAENINLDRIETEDDIKDLLNGMYMFGEDAVQKAKRGVISQDQTAADAAKLGDDAPAEALARLRGIDALAYKTRMVEAGLATKVKTLATLAGQSSDAATKAQFKETLTRAYAVMQYSAGVKGEAGRLLSSMKKSVNGEGTSRAIMEAIQQNGTADIDKLAGIIANIPDNAGVIKAINAATKPNWKDALNEVYINSLFSPVTLGVNTLSNFLTIGNTVVERYAGAFKSQFGGSGDLTMREANTYALGLAKAIPEAFMAFGRAWKNQTPELSNVVKQEGYRLGGFRGESFGIDAGSTPLMKGLGKGLDLFGIGLRNLPGATMSLMASDELFKVMLYRAELSALAQREALKSGLKGGSPEFAAKVRELELGANKAPAGEPYHGLSVSAFGHAEQNTFTEKLGTNGEKFISLVRSYPPATVVLPFIKTPINLVKYVARRTPGMSAFSDHIETELAAGGARADLAHAQMSLGAMYLTSGMALAAGGYLRGEMTTNLDARRNLDQLGVQTGAIVSPESGDQLSIGRLDPIASFFTMSASTFETVMAYVEANGDDLSDEEMGDAVMEIMSAPLMAAAKFAVNKTWSQGAVQFLDSINNQTVDEYGKRVAGNFLPGGNSMKWANQQLEIDPLQREADTILEEWKAKIPGLSKDLPPVPDLLGEPVKAKQWLGGVLPVAQTDGEKDPVREELRRLQLLDPNKVIMGAKTRVIGDVKLDAVESWNFMQFVKNLKDENGNDLKGGLQAIIEDPDYQAPQVTDSTRNEMLKAYYDKRRDMAKLAIQYDAAAHAEGRERKYAQAFNLHDYKRSSSLATMVARRQADKVKKKLGNFGDTGATRQTFIQDRLDDLVRSNIGDQLNESQ
jgi:hypothetical protein